MNEEGFTLRQAADLIGRPSTPSTGTDPGRYTSFTSSRTCGTYCGRSCAGQSRWDAPTPPYAQRDAAPHPSVGSTLYGAYDAGFRRSRRTRG